MPKFLTVDEMVTRVGMREMLQIAGIGRERSEDGRTLDTDKVEAALSFTDDLVIAKLRERYATIINMTPEAAPDLLKGYVADIARYRLRARSGDQNQVTEESRKRYEDAISFLKEIQSGKSSLDIAGDPRGKETRVFGIGDANPDNRSVEILAGW